MGGPASGPLPTVHLHGPASGPVCGATVTDRATEQTAYLGDVTCVPCLGTLSLATRQRWVALFNAKYPDGIE